MQYAYGCPNARSGFPPSYSGCLHCVVLEVHKILLGFVAAAFRGFSLMNRECVGTKDHNFTGSKMSMSNIALYQYSLPYTLE